MGESSEQEVSRTAFLDEHIGDNAPFEDPFRLHCHFLLLISTAGCQQLESTRWRFGR